METLETRVESVFSAEQRKGRAGRVGPGKCVRLWNECDKRISETPPEILRSDLMNLVLECAVDFLNLHSVEKEEIKFNQETKKNQQVIKYLLRKNYYVDARTGTLVWKFYNMDFSYINFL